MSSSPEEILSTDSESFSTEILVLELAALATSCSCITISLFSSLHCSRNICHCSSYSVIRSYWSNFFFGGFFLSPLSQISQCCSPRAGSSAGHEKKSCAILFRLGR